MFVKKLETALDGLGRLRIRGVMTIDTNIPQIFIRHLPSVLKRWACESQASVRSTSFISQDNQSLEAVSQLILSWS
jgi:hypothetical protein